MGSSGRNGNNAAPTMIDKIKKRIEKLDEATEARMQGV
jgi:hypothetical protein